MGARSRVANGTGDTGRRLPLWLSCARSACRRRDREIGNALAVNEFEDRIGVEYRQRERDSPSHQPDHPAGLIAEAMEKRRGDDVAFSSVEPESVGEDLV